MLVKFFIPILVSSLSANAFPDWTAQTFPDSLLSPFLCKIPVPGYLCDPNELLNNVNVTVTGASYLLDELDAIRKETNCSCLARDVDLGVCHPHLSAKSHGYTLSVVLLQSMRMNEGETDEQSRLMAIQRFSESLRERLNRGQCDDDALIALSVNETATWTSVGLVASRVITRDLINTAQANANAYFIKGDYTGGLYSMIRAYGRAFRGEPPEAVKKSGWHWPLPLWAVIVIGVALIIAVIAIISLIVGYCCCRKREYQMAPTQ